MSLNVVDANVIAEHSPRVGVGLFDRRSGKADEGGIRQRVTHMPRETVDKIVLAAVGLIRNDDNVAPLGQAWMLAAFFFREKFLNGREYHAATGDLEQLAQMLAVCGLNWFLPQQFMAAGKCSKKLVVQIIAVCQHNQRWIFHCRFKHKTPGIKRHRQRLA